VFDEAVLDADRSLCKWGRGRRGPLTTQMMIMRTGSVIYNVLKLKLIKLNIHLKALKLPLKLSLMPSQGFDLC
jgi:hypothetical protein